MAKAREFPGALVVACRTVMLGTDPDITMAIFEDCVDVIARETVRVIRIVPEIRKSLRRSIKTTQTILRAEPKHRIAIFDDRTR